MITVSADLVMDTLREVVSERPNYVYEPPGDGASCGHALGGCPSCLVGHVLHRLGVPISALQVADNQDVSRGAADLTDPEVTE